MINIGIVTHTNAQLAEITQRMTNYLHCPPCYRSKNVNEWHLPFLNITIIMYSIVRGHKFDLLYYDERIDEECLFEVLYPCCPLGRPALLKHFLSKITI